MKLQQYRIASQFLARELPVKARLKIMHNALAIKSVIFSWFACLAGAAMASSQHGPLSTQLGPFETFAAFLARAESQSIYNCQSNHGWANCKVTRRDFCVGEDVCLQGPSAGPKYGYFSNTFQQMTVWARGCRGETCAEVPSPAWFQSTVCADGQLWKKYPDGSSKCTPYEVVNPDRPGACPKVGRPIYPLTGVQRHEIPLNVSIGGTDVTITYDTRDQLPEANGDVPWVDAAVPSFGVMWQSNVHRSLVLRGANSTPGTAYTGVTLQRGANNNESFVPTGGIDTCGGAVGGAGGSYASSVDPAHQVVFIGSSARLIDQRDRTEQVFGNGGALATVSRADGGVTTYAYSTAVTATAPAVGLLMSISDQFGRSVHFAYEQPSYGGYAPRINQITGADGQISYASYDPDSGNLTSLTWPDGKSMSFLYELSGLPWAMTGIVDENGARHVTLGYDTLGRASASQLAGGVESYSVQYDTNPLVAPHWQVDETLVESVPVVCRARHWVTPSQQVLTDPAGQSIAFGSASNLGMPMSVSQTQPAGSGCAATSSAQTYDAANNATSRDDFNGNRTCYAYDLTRNLATVTLEGLPRTKACPADLSAYYPSTGDISHPERKTTTSWHPDWVLKASEAEPKKVTTWVYNGQLDPIGGGTANCVTPAATLPDGKPIAVLCARYEQATTDLTGALGFSAAAAGATRKWSYTYNQYGQVLTETAPKLSATDTLSHTTTYVYYSDTSMAGNVGHTLGDLYSVTNPRGQTTTFTSYDGAGRLLSSSDANSVVTTQTYWPRGWLHTQTVTPTSGTALTTTYDYWPTGLLKTVTMPDASSLNYGYDDAHRLTDITDAAGNKIHYVLDNVGNRQSEQVSDASGNLASTVSRVFDSLNRVQSQIGLAH